MSNNDASILNYILKYCSQINETSTEFDNSKDRFDKSATFRNAVCLCLLQIGELVSVLSDEFKEENQAIQWREITRPAKPHIRGNFCQRLDGVLSG